VARIKHLGLALTWRERRKPCGDPFTVQDLTDCVSSLAFHMQGQHARQHGPLSVVLVIRMVTKRPSPGIPLALALKSHPSRLQPINTPQER
jgi:hypothetical protein